MEQLKILDTGEDTAAGCAQRLVDRVNEWLREQGDKITITHRHVGADSNGYPIVWMFYVSR